METPPRVVPYPLRMPDELRTRLEEAAKAGSRSLHAEIVQRLEASFERVYSSHVQAGGGEIDHGTRVALSALEFTKDMLARLLGGVLELVPEADRSERLVVMATQIAKGIEFKDEVAFRKGLALLLEKPELAGSRAHESVPDPSYPSRTFAMRDKDAAPGEPPTYVRMTADGVPMQVPVKRISKELVLADAGPADAKRTDARKRETDVQSVGSGSYIEAADQVLTERGLKGLSPRKSAGKPKE